MEDNQALENTDDRTAQAHDLVKRHTWYSGGVGLIPIPYVGTIANMGVQLKMLKSLSDHYGVEFSDDLGKKLIGALLGGLTPNLTAETASSLLKSIPMVGGLISMATTPLVNSAATYAVGRVFIQHFESGGNLLNFDPEKMKAYFAEQYDKGKSFVADKKAKGGKPSPSTA